VALELLPVLKTVVSARAWGSIPQLSASWPGRLLDRTAVFQAAEQSSILCRATHAPLVEWEDAWFSATKSPVRSRYGVLAGCRKAWKSVWPGTRRTAVRIRPSRLLAPSTLGERTRLLTETEVSSNLTVPARGRSPVQIRPYRACALRSSAW
jgi:hypothetical protein